MSEWVDFKAVKAQVGIEAVLGHYSLKLRRVNASSLRGRCPLPSHVSKKRAESFGVNVDKNVWACQSASYMEGRGGRKGGNVLDFVAHMEGCSVRDAALNLNHWFNVQDDQDDLTTVATETAVRRPPSRKQGKKLAAKEKSPEGESEGENKVLGFELKGIDSSHAYLKTRGIKPETADHFGVGFFPGKGSMKGRVVFPIRNPAGELVGYAGRSIDDSEPRYKVPGGLKKSLLLWGLDSAVASQKARGAVVVVEGFFAAMKLHQAGFEQVVALMGTTLSEDQEELLLEHFDRVVLLLDGDEAGRLASREIGGRLCERGFVRVVPVPEGSDPDRMSSEQIQGLLAEVL